MNQMSSALSFESMARKYALSVFSEAKPACLQREGFRCEKGDAADFPRHYGTPSGHACDGGVWELTVFKGFDFHAMESANPDVRDFGLERISCRRTRMHTLAANVCVVQCHFKFPNTRGF